MGKSFKRNSEHSNSHKFFKRKKLRKIKYSVHENQSKRHNNRDWDNDDWENEEY